MDLASLILGSGSMVECRLTQMSYILASEIVPCLLCLVEPDWVMRKVLLTAVPPLCYRSSHCPGIQLLGGQRKYPSLTDQQALGSSDP